MTATNRMQAVVFGANEHESLGDAPIPQARPGEVLIKVDYCGICGSDLHAAKPDFHVGVTMGHEFSGTIADTGPEVSDWQAGERVCVNPNGNWCGVCGPCRSGSVNLCLNIWDTIVGLAQNGGMAPYAAVPTKVLHRLPAEVSPEEGALVEPLAVAVRTVRRSGITVGEPAVVYGAGPIGLLVIKILRLAGAGRITAVEPSHLRAQLAADFGADRVIDPTRQNPRDVFEHRRTPRYAFECSGVADVTALALEALPAHGRLTVTGFSRRMPAFRSQDLLFKELEIRGSYIYIDEFQDAIDILARKVVDVSALITDRRPLAGSLQAFEDMRQGGSAIKILLGGS